MSLEKLYEKYTFTILSRFHHISHTWFGYIISVLNDREIINFFPSQKNKKEIEICASGSLFHVFFISLKIRNGIMLKNTLEIRTGGFYENS